MRTLTYFLIILTGCKVLNDNNNYMSRFNFIAYQDHHSHAQPNDARMEHLSLDLSVDFQSKTISGLAKIKIADHNETKLFLDTKGLIIERILIDERLTVFKLHPADSVKGSKLEVSINKGDKLITVYYRTQKSADALQWLEASQTEGKIKPILFTQSQFILARSWIPCQDSPGLRFTFDAKITVPKGYMALMSTQNPTQLSKEGVYYFRQERPIPAYLMSLAVGEFVFGAIGSRTGVYAEPAVVEKALAEFADLEKMLLAAEKLFGPYQWKRYDVLVLPNSFPFGGMENPGLTFVSPTILTADKSLVSLLAHELAHSWSGNWVTNATWEDFWLNEGFTVYSEYRIMEELYGKSYADMLSAISLQDLKRLVSKMKDSPDTKLKLSLKGRDPVEAMTPIAYDKGYFFLKRMEQSVGREKWDAFLKKYFNDFALKSITTEEFIFYLEQNLEGWKDFGIDKWIYGVGLPDDCPVIESGKILEAQSYATLFAHKQINAAEIPKNWVYPQWLVFLSQQPKPMSLSQMADLDQTFSLTQTKNTEVAFAWFEHCIASHYELSYAQIEAFLTKVGRKKFVYPLFELMAEDAQLKAMGYEIYRKARPNYHYITFSSVEPLFSEFLQGN